MMHSWAEEHSFELFPEQGFESVTLTCVESNGMDVAEFIRRVGGLGFEISNGYGQLKGKTFRVAHMADTSIGEFREVLEAMGMALEACK
jgi:aspartate aminotransferase-like enzyme